MFATISTINPRVAGTTTARIVMAESWTNKTAIEFRLVVQCQTGEDIYGTI
jgi:hypothetical protein